MKRTNALLLVVMALCAFTSTVSAQTAHNAPALSQMGSMQEAYADSRVWVQTDKGGVIRYASGVILDPWNVLISGHQVFELADGGYASNVVVGRGSNYMSNPGTTFDVENYIVHPSWQGTTPMQGRDVALLHLATPITDASSLVMGSALMGNQLVGVGYGRPGIVGQGYLDPDGQARAMNMYVDDFGLSGSISSDYIRSDFLPMWMRGDPLSGVGTSGFSGSGVFNTDGELVGLVVGGGGPPTQYFSATFSLRTELIWDEFILPNMKVVPAPGPTTVFAVATASLLCKRRRNQNTGAKRPVPHNCR